MTKKFFERDFSFSKFSGLDGYTTVSYIEQSGAPHPFTVEVKQTGLTVKGQMAMPISTLDELNDFARLIGEAWGEHRKLCPKIVTNAAGH